MSRSEQPTGLRRHIVWRSELRIGALVGASEEFDVDVPQLSEAGGIWTGGPAAINQL
jgi:hypothetical protein